MAVMPTINRINAQLRVLADGKTVRYLNVNDKLADKDGKLFDGMMRATTASDGEGISGLGRRLEADLHRTAGAPGRGRPRAAGDGRSGGAAAGLVSIVLNDGTMYESFI